MQRKLLVLTLMGLIALSLFIVFAPTQSYGQTAATPTPDITATPEATTEFSDTSTPTPTDGEATLTPIDGDATPTNTPSDTPTETDTPTATAIATDQYFPETGFTVPAVFMKYWSSHGGLGVFGYPISEARTETNADDGKNYTVQYFERNRFEYHPENGNTPNDVLLGLLGAELTTLRTFPTAAPFTSTDTSIYFPETQHSLSEPFLSYWQKTGGLGVFGYPISEPFTEKSATDGKEYTVQYFQRNRFEYHPENQAPYDVLLGLLGHDAMAIQDAATAWGTPVPGGQPVTRAVWPPTKPAVGQQFLQGPTVGDGMVAQLYYQDIDRNLSMLNDLRFKWVTQQVEWKDAETPKGVYYFSDLDNIVDAAQAHNIKIMLSVVKAPSWETGGFNGLPKDPKDMYDFMKALATHYSGRVSAYMIYNEVNLIGESGDINPARYVEVLKQGYLGVKAGDPHAIVLSAALAPTGVQDPKGTRAKDAQPVVTDLYYLEEMYKYNDGEVRKYFDVLGTHPYGFNNPPETKWPDNPNLDPRFPYNSKKQQVDWYNLDDSFYFRRIEEQRAIMEKYGDGPKQMWVTEYGWCSDYRTDGYGECKYNTLQQQGEYIVRAIQYAHKYYPWMGVMFLWNLNFSTFQDWYTGPSHFSIINPDWSARPAYFALKNRP